MVSVSPKGLEKLKSLRKKSNKSKDKYLVALDIGSEFVKVLISRVKGEKLEIIGVGKSHQSLDDMKAGAVADITGVVANCEKALTEAEKMSGVSAKAAVVGIAGELVKGVTHTIHYKRKDAKRPIDTDEVQRIIDKAHERAEIKAKQQIALETGNKNIEVRLVNSAIVSMQIDSYKVSNPIGFQGSEVDLQIYTAFAPMIHIGAIERVAQELDLDLIAVAAEPFAVSRAVIGTDASSNFSAILLDIGSGTSDIAVVDDGGVQGTKMFGIGGRSFTSTIANALDVSIANAEKIKLGLGDDINGADKAKIIKAVDETTVVWLDGVELSLSEFTDVDNLPNRIYMCGGGSSLEATIKALRTSEWYKGLPFTKKPVIELIVPSQIAGIEDTTGKASDHTFITAMGLLRVGYDTIVGIESQSRFKDTVNRILSI